MTSYLILGGAAVTVGAYFYGVDVGRDSVVAEQERTRTVVREALDNAQTGAAKAIADMEIKNVTINQPIRTEVRTRTVYAECKHTDAGVRALNAAITGRSEPLGESQLPRANPAPSGR